MPSIRTVTLEIVRPGPPHNQLLSPLTTYMALCGEGGPVTFRLQFEHRQLLNRLERLRYVVPSKGGSGTEMVSEKMRQSEVQELGAEVARILAEIPTLTAEVSRASSERGGVLHLRLVLSGSELALIPFELSNAPQGFPGERLELLLQASAPITLTREVRRGRALPVAWDRKPRILFVFAEPAGSSVPYREHLHALRQALEPWVGWAKTDDERLPLVKNQLTVLVNASLESVRQACAEGSFTHVHILAHGIAYEEAGEQRYGLALCADEDRSKPDTVSGKRLAQALRTDTSDGRGPAEPAVVTLATCDSGAPGSVLVPGGGIAHDLHAYGVPWVIASQFPLTKAGSVTTVEALYSRLLWGNDPRLILHEARQRLYVGAHKDHDWGSLVAYSSLPEGFAQQLVTFRDRQMRRAIDVAFDWAENDHEAMGAALAKVNEYLERWSSLLPEDDSPQARQQKAECFGLHGASKKRAAELYYRTDHEMEAQKTLEEARGWYKKADLVALAGEHLPELRYSHWTASQYLSLTAILNKKREPELWAEAKDWAQAELTSADRSARAWAYASLAELEMLGVYHQPGVSTTEVKRRVLENCQELIRLVGPESFHAFSTRRQFQRYLKKWWDRDVWRDIAKAAVEILSERAEVSDLASKANTTLTQVD